MRLPAARALQRIRQGTLSPGYLLLGKQIYWRDRIWHSLREACGQDRGAVQIAEFDLRQCSWSAVIAEAQARSLLAQRQLLLVRNAQGLLSARGGGKEAASQPATATKQADLLSAYFRDPNPDSILVLEMMDVDLNSEDWREREKVKSRLESFGNRCDVILLSTPGFAEAVELVREAVAERGRAISTKAAQQLVSLLDREMGRIQMEIDKLCIYKEETGTIEVEDLDYLGAGAVVGTQLPLTEAIGSGNTPQALEALAATADRGTYPPLILAEVTRYLRQLILLRENRVREPQLAAKLLWTAKLPAPQIALPKLLEQAKHSDGKAMLQGLKLAYHTELALRSSPPDSGIILEQLVIRLIRSLHPTS